MSRMSILGMDAMGWTLFGSDRNAVIDAIRGSFERYGPAPEDEWDATNRFMNDLWARGGGQVDAN